MRSEGLRTIAVVTALLVLIGTGMAAQDKYTVKVPGGLAFSEFRGYEGWQLVSISQDGPLICSDPRESRDDQHLQGRLSR